MKVYVLASIHPTQHTTNIMGVFSKPKVARNAFDNHFGVNTKHKWVKMTSEARKFNEFFIVEWVMDAGIESED